MVRDRVLGYYYFYYRMDRVEAGGDGTLALAFHGGLHYEVGIGKDHIRGWVSCVHERLEVLEVRKDEESDDHHHRCMVVRRLDGDFWMVRRCGRYILGGDVVDDEDDRRATWPEESKDYHDFLDRMDKDHCCCVEFSMEAVSDDDVDLLDYFCNEVLLPAIGRSQHPRRGIDRRKSPH